MAEAKPAPVADRAMISVRSSDLTVAEQQRVKALQRLVHVPDRPTYLALQQEISQQLNMSVRNVQHLIGLYYFSLKSSRFRYFRCLESEN